LTKHEKALNPRSQRSKSAMNITPTKTDWHNPKERIRQEKNQQHSQKMKITSVLKKWLLGNDEENWSQV
jgi:hypothetical protein